jgi:hypothetical protein
LRRGFPVFHFRICQAGGYIAVMIAMLRPFTAFLMTLALLLMGQGAAAARGLPGPDGSIVICTGSGPVVIFVNAEGEPAAPPHICPDCALSLIQAAHDASLTLCAPLAASGALCIIPRDMAADRKPVTAQACDPPRAA